MKKLLSLLFALLMIASCVTVISAAGTGFSDVAETRWSASAIRYAVDRGYMNGVGNGKFDPTGTLTRGMVATVLWRREGSPAPTVPSGFSDVPAGAWYADAVAWAMETGVVRGMTNTTFAPNAFITREQLATMLFRFSSYAPVSVPERADLTPFADDEKTSGWAKESLEWAVEAGLINGTDGNRLAPSGNATREQFAAIIERYDGSFKLVYNEPVFSKTYTEPEYPLANDADFFVAPDGDDSADGSLAHPFRTWQRATDAVRALDRTGRTGIKVAFKAGDYGPLSVTLNAEDSGTPECPVTYVKYGDGDVVFDNGVTVKAEEFSPISEEEKGWFRPNVRDSICVADVKGRITDSRVDSIVFSDSRQMNVARFPNKFYDNTDSLFPDSGYTSSLTTLVLTNPLVTGRIAGYHDISNLKLYGFLTFGWYKETLSVGSYDYDTHEAYISDYKKARSADFTGGLRWEIDAETGDASFKDDLQYAIVNVTEELDAESEFLVDAAAGKLYVCGQPENYYFVGGSDKMVTMNDVRCVTIRGLDFYNSQDKMIEATGDGITVEDCIFSGCSAEETVRLEIPEGANAEGPALGTTVRGCEFKNAAGNGLEISGCRRGANRYKGEANVTVDNNYFNECNLVFANTGALSITVSGAVVSHNYFYSNSWEGIDYRGTSFMTAEYNVFERTCYNGDDTGAVNDWDNFGTVGNVIRYNLFLSGVGGMVGRYCAYIDNATGTDFSNNLIYDCGVAVMMNGNRDNKANGNLIVNTGYEGAAPITVREGCSAESIRAGETGDFTEVLNSSNYKQWKEVLDSIRADPATEAAAAENAPWLLGRTYDTERWADPDFVINIVVEVTGNRFFNRDSEAPHVWTDDEDALM
ncbi:MAG: S-layer homology domain-containing protein, partial [Clostridia bacterium]|nr:S-layer homology domain-containing protein [Clostridia bacterium]